MKRGDDNTDGLFGIGIGLGNVDIGSSTKPLANDDDQRSVAVDLPVRQRKSKAQMPNVRLIHVVEAVLKLPNVTTTSREDYERKLRAAYRNSIQDSAIGQRVFHAQMFGFLRIYRDAKRTWMVTITPLGLDLFDPQKKPRAMSCAFGSVSIYRDVVNEYEGLIVDELDDDNLDAFLKAKGIGTYVASRNRRIMMKSAKDARWFDVPSNRLRDPFAPTSVKRVVPGRFMRPADKVAAPVASPVAAPAIARNAFAVPSEGVQAKEAMTSSATDVVPFAERCLPETGNEEEMSDSLLALAVSRMPIPKGREAAEPKAVEARKTWYAMVEAVIAFVAAAEGA